MQSQWALASGRDHDTLAVYDLDLTLRLDSVLIGSQRYLDM